MDRRNFLRLSGAAALTAAWTNATGCAPNGGGAGADSGAAGAAGAGTGTASAAASGGAAGFPLASVGVQLYTLRTLLGQNLEQTLQSVAAAGYRQVETFDWGIRDAAQLRAQLDRAGLASVSGHWPLERVERDVDAQIATAKALGQQYVIIPWLAEDQRRSLDDYRRLAERLNRMGERVRAAGLQLGYHNHDFEFQTFGGSTPALDVMLQNTEPANVVYELDIFWAVKAGHEPLTYFERYPGRFPLWHIKDATAAPERRMVDVGQGAIDWGRLFAAREQAGLRYGFVEHDNATDPLQTIRAGRAHLQTVLGG